VAAEMAKVRRDAASFQADMQSSFQRALKKFEGLIELGTHAKAPTQTQVRACVPTQARPAISSSTPSISAPNVINLVITAPTTDEAPTTSVIQTLPMVQQHQPSLKGKEPAAPLALIDTVSISESIESDESILER
jgi:hypothetical protein